MDAVDPTKLRQATLTAAQVEEIYAKMELVERRDLADWAKSQSKQPQAQRVLFMPEGAEGRPTSWQVRTLDTNRLAQFVFPKLLFHVVPNVDTKENLFKMTTFVLRRVAVPMAFALARYERAELGLVLAVPAPLEVLVAFAESQKRQDDLERKATPPAKENGGGNNDDDGSDDDDEHGVNESNPFASAAAAALDPAVKAELDSFKSLWEKHNLDQALLRSFSHAILKHRADQDPAFIVLYSLQDKDFCLALFWHAELLQPWVATIPGFVGKKVVAWPIRDHSPDTQAPELMCERPGCPRSGGPSTNAAVIATFEAHQSSRDHDQKKLTISRVRERWRTDLEPAMHKELEALDSSLEEKELTARRDKIMADYAAKIDTIEKAMVAEEERRAFVPLSRCARCKVVLYCSRACQQDDWPRHKLVCTIASS